MPQQRPKARGRNTKSPANPSHVADRAPKETTDSDLYQTPDDELPKDEESQGAVDEPNIMYERLDKRPYSSGKKVENQLPDDDQNLERLVEEGIDEAQRDEMVTAAKDGTRSEG